MKLALTPEDVTPAWLTEALRAAGVLRDAKVTSIAARRVGNGMLGDSVQFTLGYDRSEDEAPSSVVGKFASTDPVSRQTGVNVGLYKKEVRFYQRIRDTVRIRTPRPYVALLDEETHDFTLILEDMAPARGGDQILGCSIADAECAMHEAAGLHGPRWRDPTLADIDALTPNAALAEMLVGGFPGFMQAFKARYDDMLEPAYMAFCQDFADRIGLYFRERDTPPTLQHTDYRLDNMLFAAKSGAAPLAVLDWQSISIGYGALDVGYFNGASLLPDDRRAHEERLVKLYLEELRAHGVKDYGFDAFWRDYRIGLLQGVFTAIFASVGTVRTERGDQMFLTMARRHCEHAMDLDSLALLDSGA